MQIQIRGIITLESQSLCGRCIVLAYFPSRCNKIDEPVKGLQGAPCSENETYTVGDAKIDSSTDEVKLGGEFKLVTGIELRTTKTQSSNGPSIAPSMPNKYIPPTKK